MWLITLILGALVIYLSKFWVNSYFKDWKKRGIPYSPSSSPFSMLYGFFIKRKGLLELMKEDYVNGAGHKFIGYFQMFSPGIMIRDADLIHRICIKDFSYFVDRTSPTEISDLITENVSSLNGDKWRTLRHKMTPTFTSGKLKMMFEPIRECCDEVVAFIDNKIGQPIEARDCMFKYSINVVGNVSFGLKVDALNEETEKDNEFLKISRRFFKPSFMLMVKFMITMTMPKVRKYIRFSMVDKEIDIFFRTLVNDMVAHREKTGEVRNDFLQLMLDHKNKEENALTDLAPESKTNLSNNAAEEPEDSELLEQLNYMQGENDNYKSQKVFTNDCIVAQTFTFISGGSETIAAALSLVLYELAVNPDCQKKVQDEIDQALSKDGFTYNAIRNMNYTEQVLHESLRLHTAAPFLTRICTRNYKVPDTDVVIEKGTFIALPVHGVNHDPHYFPDPEKFDPDRFEDPGALNPGTFLTFGSGPRMCIAKRLAILEVKMLVAAVFKNFTVSLSSKTKVPLKVHRSSIFQHVEGGIWLEFQRRK